MLSRSWDARVTRPPPASQGRPAPMRDLVPVPRLGAHPDARGTSFAVYSRGRRRGALPVDDDGRERRIPLTAPAARRLARSRRGRPAGPALRLPGRTARGTRCTATASTPRSCWPTPTPAPSTASCASTLRCFGPAAGTDDSVPDTATRAPFVPQSVVVDPRFDWGGRPAARRPVGGHGGLRAARAGLHRGASRRPRGPARTYAGLAHPAAIEHLVGLGVTTSSCCRCTTSPASRPCSARASQLLGLQLAGLLRPARRLLLLGGSRGEQVREFRAWSGPCTRPASRCCSTSSTTTPRRAASTGRRCRWRGLDNPAYYRLRRRPAATST